MKKVITLGAAVTALAVVPAALAHVGPSPSSAPAGSTTIVGFTIGHGCDGSPTRSVAMQIPAGVTGAKPRPVAGWKVTVKTGTLPAPIKNSAGETITKGVTQITWSGGSLPDAFYETFEVRLGMPSTPGKTVYFPIVQKCAKGEHRWIEIPAAGQAEPESPAPGVAIVKAAAHAHG